jgi:hypothetical protein
VVVARTLHVREPTRTTTDSRKSHISRAASVNSIDSARRAHAYDRQERRVGRNVRETPRCGRDPQRAQRPVQRWERVRRVLESVSTALPLLLASATRTARPAAHPSSRAAICACSCAPTTPGGVRRSPSSSSSHRVRASSETAETASSSPRKRRARLTTAHHIGTVFESASGRRLPARVESTRMILY